LAEETGVIAVTKADGGQGCAFTEEGWLIFAQLRDVLAAEDSAKVAEKDDYGWFVLPEGAEAELVAIGVWEDDVGELAA